MYIRIVTTYCSKEHKLIGKEAHLDNFDIDENLNILDICMYILNSKLPQIEKMFPPHLKNQDFDIIFHGDYLASAEYVRAGSKPGLTEDEGQPSKDEWQPGARVFNVKQMGTPEVNKPTIITT